MRSPTGPENLAILILKGRVNFHEWSKLSNVKGAGSEVKPKQVAKAEAKAEAETRQEKENENAKEK